MSISDGLFWKYIQNRILFQITDLKEKLDYDKLNIIQNYSDAFSETKAINISKLYKGLYIYLEIREILNRPLNSIRTQTDKEEEVKI